MSLDRVSDDELEVALLTGTFVAGTWVSHGTALPVHDPDTGRVVALVHSATLDDVDHALGAAHAMARTWARTPSMDRSDVLTRIADVMSSRRSLLATVISLEVGKPLAESH